jgi:hypothetical protein
MQRIASRCGARLTASWQNKDSSDDAVSLERMPKRGPKRLQSKRRPTIQAPRQGLGAPSHTVPDGPCRAPVAQLDRAPDYESGGQRFESFRARQVLQCLQQVERAHFRPNVLVEARVAMRSLPSARECDRGCGGVEMRMAGSGGPHARAEVDSIVRARGKSWIIAGAERLCRLEALEAGTAREGGVPGGPRELWPRVTSCPAKSAP